MIRRNLTKVIFDTLPAHLLTFPIDAAQGISPDPGFFKGKFDYLDLPDVASKLIEFTDGKLTR